MFHVLFACCFMFLLLLKGNQTANTRLTAFSTGQSGILLPESYDVTAEFLALIIPLNYQRSIGFCERKVP